MQERVLRFGDALDAVLQQAQHLHVAMPVETVPLLQSVGRVLAATIAADRDQPGFDRATRDGYALRASDVDLPLHVMGSVRAGERWSGAKLAEGEAIEIMTGAPMPAGADAVVMVEHTTVADETLHVEKGRTLRVGENVVPQGAEARAGAAVLPAGRVMEAAEIAVAASCGCAEIDVFHQPKVAIVATGDELVELKEPLKAWQIRNSNSYALAALVGREGGFAGRLEIARDTRQDLFERVAQASLWDLMLLSGGVSRGKYDLVEAVLAEFGAEFFFTGAMIQPGRPVVFGRLPKRGTFQTDADGGLRGPGSDPWSGEWTYFFGLPGNPVSTQVCFHLFVAPLLRALAGRTEIAPRFVEARLAEDVKGGAKVTRFLPAELGGGPGGGWAGVTVRVVGWQGSGDVAANARGDCYCMLPSGEESFKAGDRVRVLLR